MRSQAEFLQRISTLHPHQPEFYQSVEEVMSTIWSFVAAHPPYQRHALLERLIEPERIICFRVAWLDDNEQVQINRGYRVQHSQSLGPYKGGIRFHPSVNLSILKFLAFEQTFKNALTGLPLGSGKGGSDFDPRGRSDEEVMRFCQAFMLELHRHIGEGVDVPAGDIGVGAREVGYMTGMMKRLSNSTAAAFTGKGLTYGGSLLRTEATGYGLIYFVQNALKRMGQQIDGKTVLVSGSGNVAQHAIERAIHDGAKVLTASDSGGTVYDPEGFTPEKLEQLKQIKNQARGRIADYAKAVGAQYLAGQTPWSIVADIALPCATQNEIDLTCAQQLIQNGVQLIGEGANMPSTSAAIAAFEQAGVIFLPAKAANAGGVATSGLEMSQNAQGLMWSRDEVDSKLRAIMHHIHESCVQHGQCADGRLSYVMGANIAGFVRVADAMLQQGVL